MLTFLFWCPSCKKEANATADPVALLFGGTPELEVTCSECETVFKANIVQTATGMEVKAQDDGSE